MEITPHVFDFRLILASASPRRHELLCAAGIEHLVVPVSISEVRQPGESPRGFVMRMAEEKATAIECGSNDVILGADTTVSVDEEVYGKPSDAEDAVRMLQTLSGRDHWVYTGICLRSRTRVVSDVAATRVSFVRMTEEEIQEYTRSGEPVDRAGGYAIQGLASKFVSAIEGSYQNVVGLPVSLVYRHLKAL